MEDRVNSHAKIQTWVQAILAIVLTCFPVTIHNSFGLKPIPTSFSNNVSCSSKDNYSNLRQTKLSGNFSDFETPGSLLSDILLHTLALQTYQSCQYLSSAEAFTLDGSKALLLTLSQTTKFRLFQTERGCRQQFQIL